MTRDDIIQAYKSGRRDFTGLDLDAETLDLSDLELAGINFSRSFIIARFDNSDLRNACFESANIKTCTFVQANLTAASFREAAIDGTDFSGAIIDRTSYSGATEHGYEMKEDEHPVTDLPPYGTS